MAVQKRTRASKVRWVGRYRDPAGKEHSRTFDTRREAAAWVAERERDMRRGEWIDPESERTTLGQLAEEWHRAATRPNTIATRKAFIDNLGELADIPIRLIRPSHIADWRKVLLTRRPWVAGGKPLSESTVAIMTGQLAGLFDRAIEDGLMHRRPRIEGDKAPKNTAVRADQLLTAEQIGAMVRAANTDKFNSPARPWLSRMIIVAAGSGMRISEIGGLKVRDVDFLRRVIHVRQQASTDAASLEKLKSESSVRDIPVPQHVVDAIAEQLAEHPRGAEQTVWIRDDGKFHNRASIGQAMRRLLALHGLPKAGFHDLRHYYASALIAAGVPVTGVQVALGHARPATTLNTYTHLWPGSDQVTRDAASRAMDEVRDQCGTGPILRAVGENG